MSETDDNVKVYKHVVVTVEFSDIKAPDEAGTWPRGINQRLSLAMVGNIIRDLDEAGMEGEYDVVATRVQDIPVNRTPREKEDEQSG